MDLLQFIEKLEQRERHLENQIETIEQEAIQSMEATWEQGFQGEQLLEPVFPEQYDELKNKLSAIKNDLYESRKHAAMEYLSEAGKAFNSLPQKKRVQLFGQAIAGMTPSLSHYGQDHIFVGDDNGYLHGTYSNHLENAEAISFNDTTSLIAELLTEGLCVRIYDWLDFGTELSKNGCEIDASSKFRGVQAGNIPSFYDWKLWKNRVEKNYNFPPDPEPQQMTFGPYLRSTHNADPSSIMLKPKK